jgi:hypothetical protein
MTSPILASSMLKTANLLAGATAGQGRPSLSNLRRATSTAYYALFHQITRHGVLASIPTATEKEIAYVTRWFTHTGIRKASGWVIAAASSRPPKKEDAKQVELIRRVPNGVPPAQLVTVAEAFVELQEARHEADYSNEYNPIRYPTFDHIQTADSAVRATWSMWRAMDSPKEPRQAVHDSYQRFLQLALLASGGPKAR